MMYSNEKNNKASAEQEVEPGKVTVCYVCGKQTVAEGELCRSCIGVISTSLQSLYTDETMR